MSASCPRDSMRWSPMAERRIDARHLWEVRGLDLYWDKLPREDSNSTNGKSLTRTDVDLRGTDHSARAAAGTTGRYSSWVRL